MMSSSLCHAIRVNRYPALPPFSPSVKYSEAPFDDLGESNPVYDGFRNLMHMAGYDNPNFGKREWNPLGVFIQPGQTVLIKPNWVKHVYLPEIDIESFITHTSLIRAVLDYVVIALKGQGHVIVGDAPVQAADFDKLQAQTCIQEVMAFLASRTTVKFDIMDFRVEVARIKNGVVVDRPKRSVQHIPVNLGRSSEHDGIDHYTKYRVTHYDPRKMVQHHNSFVHEYLIAEPALSADVIINIPKIKCHRKAGVTACLKNQVGINASKDWLPHHSVGSSSFGGDEYRSPSFLKFVLRWTLDARESASGEIKKKMWNYLVSAVKKIRRVRIFERDPFFEGSWYGNDTLWRTILDLNKLIVYSDKSGKLCNTPQRQMLYFADAVVIGEREGPLHPSRRPMGVLLWGENPVAVDACVASLIGFNPSLIKTVDRVFEIKQFPLCDFKREDVACMLDGKELRPYLHGDGMAVIRAIPSKGWIGHIEWVAVHEKAVPEVTDESDY